ncbi:hypothetical protein [Streptomyces radiopugnans]|uniref:hypothetical protein n=1 Tax=Streptomyces radiopugnans TaxID=403935 RepID=UPI003F19397E
MSVPTALPPNVRELVTPDPELWGHPTENVLVSVAANCQHAPECTIIPMPPDPGPTD